MTPVFLAISANAAAARAGPADDPAARRTLERNAIVGRTLVARPDLPDAEAETAAEHFTADLGRDLNIFCWENSALAVSAFPKWCHWRGNRAACALIR